MVHLHPTPGPSSARQGASPEQLREFLAKRKPVNYGAVLSEHRLAFLGHHHGNWAFWHELNRQVSTFAAKGFSRFFDESFDVSWRTQQELDLYWARQTEGDFTPVMNYLLHWNAGWGRDVLSQHLALLKKSIGQQFWVQGINDHHSLPRLLMSFAFELERFFPKFVTRMGTRFYLPRRAAVHDLWSERIAHTLNNPPAKGLVAMGYRHFDPHFGGRTSICRHLQERAQLRGVAICFIGGRNPDGGVTDDPHEPLTQAIHAAGLQDEYFMLDNQGAASKLLYCGMGEVDTFIHLPELAQFYKSDFARNGQESEAAGIYMKLRSMPWRGLKLFQLACRR